MFVSYVVANSSTCDYMFSQFIVSVSSLHKQYTKNFALKFFSCMLYAPCDVEYCPLGVFSLLEK